MSVNMTVAGRISSADRVFCRPSVRNSITGLTISMASSCERGRWLLPSSGKNRAPGILAAISRPAANGNGSPRRCMTSVGTDTLTRIWVKSFRCYRFSICFCITSPVTESRSPRAIRSMSSREPPNGIKRSAHTLEPISQLARITASWISRVFLRSSSAALAIVP
jgi:hypothetical protein